MLNIWGNSLVQPLTLFQPHVKRHTFIHTYTHMHSTFGGGNSLYRGWLAMDEIIHVQELRLSLKK